MMRTTQFSIFSLLVATASLWLGQSNVAVASQGSKAYQTECSACHIAYPTKGLSTKSWKAIMGNLSDHFGDNAELSTETTKLISQYLQNHASGRRWFSSATSKSNRITDTKWFHRAHNEVPSRWVTGNPKVKTFARCGACHLQAKRGNFNEDSVRIPGRSGGLGRRETD
ncbi:MAG TPA: hypothetical protein ENI62_01960, partial [Gammaproteobacteria bacterium]|nr:hypothetical protein [Gammaproteobacteria bacterium]